MFKFFQKTCLSLLFGMNFFYVQAAEELANKSVEALEVLPEFVESEVQQQLAQPTLVALTKEESQELLQNLSKEEVDLFNKFLETLTKKLESVKDELIVSEMAEAFATKGISWNVSLSVYPCKQELRTVETIENDMLLNS